MKETQRAKILAYCKEHGSITIREAFEKLHINSPSKRISEMRNSGEYVVDDITEFIMDDEGRIETKWKRYFIKEVA
jgi:predicted ArsR family transcriptional regulator